MPIGDRLKRAMQTTIARNKPAIDATKRVAGAMAFPFVNTPKIEGHPESEAKGLQSVYFPVGVEAAPVGLYNLYNLAAEATGLPKANSAFMDRMNERVDLADKQFRQAIGVAPPSNPVELGLEVAGSLIIPGPGSVAKAPRTVRAVADAATKASKPAKAAERIIDRASSVAKGAATVAVEGALPFRQGQSYLTAAATQTPIALGIMEGIDAAVETPDYSSMREAFTGDIDAPIKPEQKSFLDYLSAEALSAFEQAQATGDEATQQQILEAVYQAQEADKARAQVTPPEPEWKDQLLAATALSGVALGAYGLHSITRNLTKARLNNGLIGVSYEPQYTTGPTKTTASFVQADQPIREAAKELDVNYEQYLATLDSVTLAPLNTKTQHAFTTGELPHSAIRTDPIAVTLNAFAKDLTPAEQYIVSEGLLARNALDDLKRTGTQAAFNDKTPNELEQIAQLLENDPKLAAYGDRIKKSYRQQLDYMLEQGLITQDMHTNLLQDRPNYVHMSRNIATDNNANLLWGQNRIGAAALARRDKLLSRSEEALGGVQAGETADPIRELPSQWSGLIRKAEINRIKTDFLERAANNAALSPFIKRLPDGEAPKSLEGVHEVFVNGQPVLYKVTDKALEYALDFNPTTQRTAFSTFLGIPKKMKEFFTTGPGAPLFAPTSAMYDTLTGIALRPKGYDLGLLNEFKNTVLDPNSLASKVSGEFLSRFDPSVWISAPVGALRLASDELAHSLGRDLAEQLMRQDGWFYRAMGPQSTQAWANRLASMYDKSIKSIMDEYGATTANLLDPAGPERTPRGMVDIAPKFYSEAAKRAYDEALAGNANSLTLALKKGGSIFEQARASSLSRTYMGMVRLLHEGFRYQAFASNLPKVIGDEELTQLVASQTRRISGDVAQFGSGQLMQEASRSALYLNVGVQTLAEVGRKVKSQPVTTAMNISAAMASMVAMQYAWAASSPENAEKLRTATDSETTRWVFTPFGEVPVPPELRMLWGPMVATLNEMSGLSRGEFDPNFINAIDTMLDGDMEFSEQGQMSLKDSAMEAGQSMLPLSPGSFPTLNAFMSSMGQDISFARFGSSEGVREIRSQDMTQLGGEGKLIDDAMTATQVKIIEDLMGTTVADYLRVALDAERALGAGGGYDQAFDVALSRIKDNTVRGSAPVRGMMFQGYERAQSVADTDFNLWYKKKEGIDKATATLRQDVKNAYITGADPRYAMLRNIDVIDPSKTGTALVPIGMVAADLDKALFPLQRRMAELRDQVNNTQSQFFSKIEDRNEQQNEFNEERRELAAQMVRLTQQAEDTIRQTIGDPTFSFQDFDPEKYAEVPWPPVPPVAEPSSPQVPPVP